MASRRLLKDTVVIRNYVGEINDRATYQETVIERCYCPCGFGAGIDSHGKNSTDNGRLYIFDSKSIAKSREGKIRKFIPYRDWLKSASKDDYWTISDNGRDYFVKDNIEYNIIGFSHKQSGTKRMWHFEVDGK